MNYEKIKPGNGQLELDFSKESTQGYENWEKEKEQRISTISQIWGLPINKKVRIKLKWSNQEINGTLRLIEQPKRLDRRLSLLLGIKKIQFFTQDIEYCTQV